jgi:hypothetical protein
VTYPALSVTNIKHEVPGCDPLPYGLQSSKRGPPGHRRDLVDAPGGQQLLNEDAVVLDRVAEAADQNAAWACGSAQSMTIFQERVMPPSTPGNESGAGDAQDENRFHLDTGIRSYGDQHMRSPTTRSPPNARRSPSQRRSVPSSTPPPRASSTPADQQPPEHKIMYGAAKKTWGLPPTMPGNSGEPAARPSPPAAIYAWGSHGSTNGLVNTGHSR